MQSAPLSAPRRSVFREPWLWFGVILIAVILAVAVVSVRQSYALAAAHARFEQHLQAEDFTAAAQDLSAADHDGTGVWSREARGRLSAAQGQVAAAQSQAANYQKAKDLLAQGKPDDAVKVFTTLGSYKDADDLAREARFAAAQLAIKEKRWRDARTLLSSLPPGLRNVGALQAQVADEVTRVAYEEAQASKRKGEYAAAQTLLTEAMNAGGNAPANLDAELQTVTALRTKAESAGKVDGIRKDQSHYSAGAVGIAVNPANFRSEVGNRIAQGDGTFVVLNVSVWNLDLPSDHANPNNFRLAAPDGRTVPPHLETYGLSGYFNAVNLNKGQKADGWLVFYTVKADIYTLYYDSTSAKASKEIAPQ